MKHYPVTAAATLTNFAVAKIYGDLQDRKAILKMGRLRQGFGAQSR
jgi:hypothetical protein